MDECSITSGYLVEMTFARRCREFLAQREHWTPQILSKGGYSTPRADVRPEQMPKQYRGLQREPLQGWVEDLRGSGVVEPTEQELEASLFLTELMDAGKAEDDIIFALEDARELMRKIKPPVEREIVWARRMDLVAVAAPPAETVPLGYEPTTFYPPLCNSAIADGMFFTYAVPGDEEGLRLKAYHNKLNRWGLFDAAVAAEEYLRVYLSSLPADWDEHLYGYHTVEVREVR